MKTLFHNVSILFIILLLLASTSVKAQNVSNELSISAGLAIPGSNDMTALPGVSFQLDYKIMNKHFGMQMALSVIDNNLDSDLLIKNHQASSMTETKWRSFSMMMKLVGRANFLKNKLLVDFNFGVGAMISAFPSQTYSYTETAENQIYTIGVAADENNQTTFAFGAGAKVNYVLSEQLGVFASYNYLSGEQNYNIVTTTLSPLKVDKTLTNIKVSYSLINVGITLFL